MMEHNNRGKLKIFFGYTEHIGKTCAMLKAAQAEKQKGIDVVAGYIDHHASEETLALLEGMEMLPPVAADDREVFDLDRALKRNPTLILVDELECSNGPGCRHQRRYQDVQELLNAGIHVYTTVNVSNIESLHDRVTSITGVEIRDRIPDSVFDNADQVELIDAEPQEVSGRLRNDAEKMKILTVEQLAALRELALRRCADRVKYLSENYRNTKNFRSGEHVLVCLSSAPSNAKIIRTAARMSYAFHSQFTALFVETPDFSVITPENRKRLQANQRLAEQLGANIETVFGEDIPYQIAEFVRLSGITKIVLGQSTVKRKHFFGKPPLTEQLISYVPDIDIHIIPDKNTEAIYRPYQKQQYSRISILKNTGKSVGILLAATFLSYLFYNLGFTDANIIMIYILGVLLTSIATPHMVYSLVSSVASVFVFNFFFTTPRFSFSAYETGYPITFVVMFLTALITATFSIGYKKQAGQSAKNAYRTKVLFDTGQLLSKAKDKNQILQATAEQIVKLSGRDTVIFDVENERLSEPRFFPSDSDHLQIYDREKELPTAEWVLKNNHSAGATTDTLSDARYLYFALRVSDRVYSVVGIETENTRPDAFEHEILLSILGESALALENEKNAREKEAAAVLAESEQLRANLLRTISHDLRTPLTTISGNVSNLLSNGSSFDEKTRRQIYTDIYDDSRWLINLVENLLYATRIEEGRMVLHTSTELLSDIVEEAMEHIRHQAVQHQIHLVCKKELMLVKADARLIIQVIVNIVDNAVKYTPASSDIVILTQQIGQCAEIQIIDHGSGISDEEKTKIFDKFYCGENKIADNRRSLGLGLYLCKAIVEAHGGTIQVADNQPQGTVFSFTLPLEEVSLHE
ncbi:MAG: DUF4118 domain-containing protein [Lachnospiraceae bacterium]